MMKGFKIRIYPTKEQEQKFWQHIGACRYIWNWMLAHQESRYKDSEKYLSAFDMINLLKPLKNDGEHEWLYEVSNASLQTICRDLDKSYKEFFKGTRRHPKFKSRKRSKPNYPVRSNTLYFKDGVVQIASIGKVRYKTDFDLPLGKDGRFYNPRISFVRSKWFLSFDMECENQAPELTDKQMGIDLGIKELAVVACDDEQLVFHNINKSKKMKELERRAKYIQHSISRKYEANRVGNKYVKTNNILREEEKLARIKAKQSNIRQNYIHQTTHILVSLLPRTVVMEDLNVTGMMKNRHLAKAIQEQNLAEFIRQMQYKCEWNGIEFSQVGRFFPSSKTCSSCGTIKEDLKLSDRTYTCDCCGLKIDRDYNAAINLMRYVA